MKRIPTISTVMTPFPWHVSDETGVDEALALMNEQEVHHLPVTDNDHRVLGLVSYQRLQALGEQGMAACLEPARCVEITERLDQVLERMSDDHIDVMVLVHHGRLAGIFTWTDACRLFARYLREPFLPPEGGDVA